MTFPLLITTAVSPPSGTPDLRMTDPFRRKFMTRAAISFWATKGITRMVVADATDEIVLREADVSDLENMGVEVEQLRYQQDAQEIIKRGKGYGEGMLISHAIENSRILQEAGCFYKSTGKTFVRNFREMDKLVNDHKIDTIFWRYSEAGELSRNWVDCRFFFTSMEFARSHLVPAYLRADDRNGGTCEFQILNEMSRVGVGAKAPRPLVHGHAGGPDAEYFDGSLGYLDGNFPCWVRRSQQA